jgi:ribosomal protein S18 acetylase RimI-like enzyme
MNQTWRTMIAEDLPLVYSMAEHIHKELHEDMDVFIERLRLFPEGCFVLEDTSLCGYLISHPYTQGKSPPLNTLLHSLPHPDCLYIHDLAILEPYRGKGHAAKMIAWLKENVRLPLTLTSVNRSESFWVRQGFAPDPSVHCSGYGSCIYMKLMPIV